MKYFVRIGDDEIEVEVEGEHVRANGAESTAHLDDVPGTPVRVLRIGDAVHRVVVRRAAHRLRLLHPQDHDHFAMLRQKLHWSETPERLRP